MAGYTIAPVLTKDDISAVATLFSCYAKSLGIDLTFQDFAAELSGLPGSYAPPYGSLLVARRTDSGEAIGCVGLRPLPTSMLCPDSNHICEMKRLYVPPQGRGLGVGKALAQAVVAAAQAIGYKAMRLDTLPNMASAQALYKTMGFEEIPAYYTTPLAGTIFLELDLTASEDRPNGK